MYLKYYIWDINHTPRVTPIWQRWLPKSVLQT